MKSNNDILPLASYETLLAEWKTQRNRAAKVSLLFFAFMLIVIASFIYWMQGKPHSGAMWLLIVALSFAVAFPFYLSSSMRKPTPSDVELSKQLRRAAGMRDDVAEGNEKEV